MVNYWLFSWFIDRISNNSLHLKLSIRKLFLFGKILQISIWLMGSIKSRTAH